MGEGARGKGRENRENNSLPFSVLFLPPPPLVFSFDLCSAIARIFPLLNEPQTKGTPKTRLLRRLRATVKNEIQIGPSPRVGSLMLMDKIYCSSICFVRHEKFDVADRGLRRSRSDETSMRGGELTPTNSRR